MRPSRHLIQTIRPGVPLEGVTWACAMGDCTNCPGTVRGGPCRCDTCTHTDTPARRRRRRRAAAAH